MSDQDSKRLSTEELDRLRTTDVSPAFMTIARKDPETVGKKRNSAREQAYRLLRDTPEDMTGDDLPVHDYGGDYVTALRKGRVGEAFVRADIANIRLLLDAFGRDYLIEALIADEGWSSERASRYVDERIDNFGNGIIG